MLLVGVLGGNFTTGASLFLELHSAWVYFFSPLFCFDFCCYALFYDFGESNDTSLVITIFSDDFLENFENYLVLHLPLVIIFMFLFYLLFIYFLGSVDLSLTMCEFIVNHAIPLKMLFKI